MHHFMSIGHEGRRRPQGHFIPDAECIVPVASLLESAERGFVEPFALYLRSLTQVATGIYVAAMGSVGLKTLNNKLSEYVRLAAAGETVLVTDRDRVVAEIVPPRVERSPILADAMLADAVRKGWLRPPAAPGSGPSPAPPPIMSLDQLLRELDEDGRER